MSLAPLATVPPLIKLVASSVPHFLRSYIHRRQCQVPEELGRCLAVRAVPEAVDSIFAECCTSSYRPLGLQKPGGAAQK